MDEGGARWAMWSRWMKGGARWARWMKECHREGSSGFLLFVSPAAHVYLTGGGEGPCSRPAEGLELLKVHLLSLVRVEPRDVSAPFLFSIDHCFAIKGQGTVMTGTVLQVR